MRNFLNLHPGYQTRTWQESSFRGTQQTNDYDCGVWAIENAWAWLQGRPRPLSVGVTNRLEIGRALLEAAEGATAAPEPTSTDEAEYLGRRNCELDLRTRALTITPSVGRSFGSIMQSTGTPSRGVTPQRELLVQTARAARDIGGISGPSTRQATPQLEGMIDNAAQVLHASNPTTPAARSVASPRGSVRSRLTTPPGLREAMNTGVSITSRGSPMPRRPADGQQGTQTGQQTVQQPVQPAPQIGPPAAQRPQRFVQGRKLRSGKEY